MFASDPGKMLASIAAGHHQSSGTLPPHLEDPKSADCALFDKASSEPDIHEVETRFFIRCDRPILYRGRSSLKVVPMPDRITFEHKVLTSGQHAITSPDIKGFCVVGAPGDTVSDVEQQAFDVLRLLQKRDRDLPQGVPLIREAA